MSKPLICKTVICKVNGITLLDLNDIKNNNKIQFDNNSTDKRFVSIGVNPRQNLTEEDNDDDMEMGEEYDEDLNNDEESQTDDHWNNESQLELRNGSVRPKKGIYEMEKVETSIESVRQYISTSRRNGKVWHQCRWAQHNKNAPPCHYGSKWSGAMVNHIRSHLGVKPFRCLYCNKLFTIACNLKNHLRIHHGLKAKIILNGGRRVRQMSTPKNGVKMSANETQEEEEEVEEEEIEEEVKSSDSSKLRIFKPSFVNGKPADNPYVEKRTLPKRNVKRNQRYIDFDDDFDEEDFREQFQNEYNEEEAEEENRKFYEKTVEDDEEYADDDPSRYVVKRRYNKRLWFVCVWNPRQCKYRSSLLNEVVNHVKKHQNIHQLVCNWNQCSASFATLQQLESHQISHKRQKFFKCSFDSCGFQTINATALQMHKLRHKRQV